MTSKSASFTGTGSDTGPEVRFAFGKNWQRFLRNLSDKAILEAEKSLRTMLDVDDLKGKTFLDIGSGSGLFSLAAMRLGAARVHSFDYDGESVACAQELKRRYLPDHDDWTIDQGDVLDSAYVTGLGSFDIVYSWGVLHHTGNMWQALDNVAIPVRRNGKLFVALYNDQGRRSRIWRSIKKSYSQGGPLLRGVLIVSFACYFGVRGFVSGVFRKRSAPQSQEQSERGRGMTYLTDLIDWIGGYPFEVAAPDSVSSFFRSKGFELLRLNSVGQGSGNNEYVFCNSGFGLLRKSFRTGIRRTHSR